jgi:hypothetical protein
VSYKFNINNTTPSAGQIDRHKDFKKLRANYEEAVKPLYKKKLYKDMRTFLVVLIILLLTYVLVEVFENEDKKDMPVNKEQNK